MSYFISQESDAGFRVPTDEFLRKLRAAWPGASVRAIADVKRKYSHEWTLSTKAGALEGRLHGAGTSIVLDGDLAAAADFAAWFQREVVGGDRDLKFYDERYHPVVALTAGISADDIVRDMS